MKRTSEYFKSKEKHPTNHNPLSEVKWETVAHELAWVLGLLEDDPNDLKIWRKVWTALKVYEGVAKSE